MVTTTGLAFLGHAVAVTIVVLTQPTQHLCHPAAPGRPALVGKPCW